MKWVAQILLAGNLSFTQESGCTFQMSGPKTIYGTIAVVSADNLASNALGGFKEGFTALRHCRQCMGTYEECKREVRWAQSDMHVAHNTYSVFNEQDMPFQISF